LASSIAVRKAEKIVGVFFKPFGVWDWVLRVEEWHKVRKLDELAPVS
jgi:hypothetical protein